MEIVLQEVTKTFGTQRAVDGVSFTARRGITGFLGPNGAGKSTTMRMITGYLAPSAGAITVGGEAVWPTTAAVRRRIGYLPEHNPLYPEMYVREYLGFIARAHRLAGVRRRVAEVIDTVGLGLEAHKPIGALSKGYRQRVGLAQALLPDPDVLVLDEPVSGLDPNQLVEIRDVIRRLGREKVVLLSTHIMQEVQALCERVLIIDRGRLVADDPIEALGGRLAGQQRIRIRCAQPLQASMFEGLAGVTSVDVKGDTATISAAADRELRPELARLCHERELDLLELGLEAASVEHTFQALTAKPDADV